MHEIFNYTLLSFSSTEVRLHRQYINSTSPATTVPLGSTQSHPKPFPQVFKSVDLYFSIPPDSSARLSVKPSAKGTSTPPAINIILPTTGRTGKSGHNIDASELPKRQSNHVRVQVMTNETSLVGLDVAGLFLTPEEASTQTLQTVLEGLPTDVADQVVFYIFASVLILKLIRFHRYLS